MKKIIFLFATILGFYLKSNSSNISLTKENIIFVDVTENQYFKINFQDSTFIPVTAAGEVIIQSPLIKPKRVDSQQISGIAAIFTGGFGLHRLFLHQTLPGLVYLAYTGLGILVFPKIAASVSPLGVVSLGTAIGLIYIPLSIPWIIGWIDAAKILGSTHDDYEKNYHHNNKLIMWLNHEKL